ncbi:hypothetical protein MKZ38_008445 [Zalerion maritima]|uniref:Protein kinase domain-containing protein n=1 Tax=Zalerion maritima TaxID=339359 RepID=A0AAD5WP42_9PEZI|nr:hypothetical protein MKZ38_008445 [Zalerion maritima]
MDGLSAAFGLVALFKDVYLTAQFIQNTARTLRAHEKEYSGIILEFQIQVFRYKNLSRLFRKQDGNVVDIAMLTAVEKVLAQQHPTYLKMVHDTISELRDILGEYTVLAMALDESYQKNSPLSPKFDRTRFGHEVLIDDSSDLEDEFPDQNEQKSSGGRTSEPNAVEAKVKRGFWPLSWTATSGKKGLKRNHPVGKAVDFGPAVEWWFTKDKLGATLERFVKWNKNLEHLVGPLMAGFGFYDKKALQARLQPDGDENIFEGSLKLSRLSDTFDSSPEKSKVIPWDEAELRMPHTGDSGSRILVEYKKFDLRPAQREDSNSSRNSAIRSGTELYGHQLARLLSAAGNQHFNTLQLHAYSFNAEMVQYAFLFDYPTGSATLAPISLHEMIVDRERGFKLELKQRFRVAQALVRSIGAFHAVGWLHKSIRSHGIKFFFSADGKGCDIDKPYLADFGFARPVDANMTRYNAPAVGDPEHDLYRHPERYDPPESSFTMVHDIYSVGVVLLEIGLWETVRMIFDEFVDVEPVQRPTNFRSVEGVSATKIQSVLMEEAKLRLGHRMGSTYREAVMCCLEGEMYGFIGTRDFANEFQKRVVDKVNFSLK